MKYFTSLILFIILIACESSDDSINTDLTGNEVSYILYQGSDYPVSGTVTIQETKHKTALISLLLIGTESGLTHPAHLHFGDIAGNGDIAAVLNPVDGASGISTTTLDLLVDESTITYAELLAMESSIKVHLSDVIPGKHTILAGGNIGLSDSKSNPFGKVEITICKSN